MNPSVASLLCACGIAGLFYLNRDKTVRTSKALWLPVIYLLIIGSRPVSVWLGVSPPAGTNMQLEGSPLDAAVFGALLAGAIAVLIWRGRRTRLLLMANWPILLYFVYCLVSVTWSPHSDVALKRWIKALDDIAMVLVVVSDPQPVAAIRRLMSCMGFILLPISLLLIKYYGDLGRGYTPDGGTMNTGVSTNKNSLGLMLLVVFLYTFWQMLGLLRAKDRPARWRQLLAHGILLIFGISLLNLAQSDTAIACSALGSSLILACESQVVRRRPGRVHALCLAIFLIGGLTMLFGGGSDVTHAMGRKSDLSGRTDIWAAILPTAPNALIGAGFESYWISPNAEVLWHKLELEGWWRPKALVNEAHDGYIEAYLNLGLAGVSLIALILISGYRHAVEALRRRSPASGVLLAYIVCAAFYSITEAGFRLLDLMWIFLLLAVVNASGIAAGIVDRPVSKDGDERFSARLAPMRAHSQSFLASVTVAIRLYVQIVNPLRGIASSI